jgi:hypothetical protein
MTESEWNTATDPEAMLEFVGHSRFAFMKSGHKLSARKFRLCAVAVCRRIWSLSTDAELRTAVETAERYADGDATEEEFADACSDSGAKESGRGAGFAARILSRPYRQRWPKVPTLGSSLDLFIMIKVVLLGVAPPFCERPIDGSVCLAGLEIIVQVDHLSPPFRIVSIPLRQCQL